MKKISKLISLILCLSLLCPTVAYAAETKQTTDSPNMKDILIDSTDDHFIVVSIPQSEAESYQKRLESDPEFRENEIQQALGGTSADSRALPPGHIEYQSYMYKRDIKAAVDAASGSGTFDKWLTGLGWTVTAASIAKLIKLSKGLIFLCCPQIYLGHWLNGLSRNEKRGGKKPIGTSLMEQSQLYVIPLYRILQNILKYGEFSNVYNGGIDMDNNKIQKFPTI